METKTIVDIRACTILYNFIVGNDIRGTWLIPANVCHYVPATLIKANQTIEIVDIDSKDFCLDTQKVLGKLEQEKDKYAGIIFVETYGVHRFPQEAFGRIKSIREDIIIVYDKCLSKPELDFQHVPSVDLVLYSTGYSKYTDLGYGGFAHLKKKYSYHNYISDYSAEEERQFESYIREKIKREQEVENHNILRGWLANNTEIKKENYFYLISSKMEVIDRHKTNLNAIYSSIIPEQLQLNRSYQNWRFNILVEDKVQIIKLLFDNGLFASSHYYPLGKLWKSKSNFSQTEILHRHVINLFNDLRYTQEMAEKTAKLIASVSK